MAVWVCPVVQSSEETLPPDTINSVLTHSCTLQKTSWCTTVSVLAPHKHNWVYQYYFPGIQHFNTFQEV